MNFNWKQGKLLFNPSDDADFRVNVCSDWYPMRNYEDKVLSDPKGIYGDLLPIIRLGDLNIVNVECLIGDAGEPITKSGPHLKTTKKAVESLTEANFHVGTLANNHIMDFGEDGLLHTMEYLKTRGLDLIGAGATHEEATKPYISTIKGTKVAVINCAEGEFSRSIDGGPGVYGLEDEQLDRQIRDLKTSCDVVIVIFHGGREYAPTPPPYIVQSLRRAVKAGADAVIGHHPHVPQGIEIYKGVPIAYSLGNFVFWQESEAKYRHTGYMLHLDFADKKLCGIEMTPYVIAPEGLRSMGNSERNQFNEDMTHVSELLKDVESNRILWEAFVDGVGMEGMLQVLSDGIGLIQKGDLLGAAKLLNICVTPAHRELYMNGMRRAVSGDLGDSPAWAKELVQYWSEG